MTTDTTILERKIVSKRFQYCKRRNVRWLFISRLYYMLVDM